MKEDGMMKKKKKNEIKIMDTPLGSVIVGIVVVLLAMLFMGTFGYASCVYHKEVTMELPQFRGLDNRTSNSACSYMQIWRWFD
jgi:hypothetical protein